MTGRDGSERPRPDSPPGSGGSPAGDDVLEQGGRQLPALKWRPPRVAVLLAAVALLVGLVVGYAAGNRHAGTSAVSLPHRHVAASPTALSAAGALALSQSGGQCSARIGHALQLGVQVTNQSAADVTLRRVKAVLAGPHSHLTGCGISDEVFIATGAKVFNGAHMGRASSVALGGAVHIGCIVPR